MKKTIYVINSLFLLLMIITFFSGCSKDNIIEKHVPIVTLDNETAIYTVKIGKTITISPKYEYAENAIYAWKENGKIISDSPELKYDATELGDKFLALSVINDAGETYTEMKISVVKLLLPTISMTVPEEGYQIIKGGKLNLAPIVEDSDNTTFSWSVNDKAVANTKDFSFTSSETGEFNVKLKTTNEDGSDEISIPVKVCNAEDLPFSWEFEQEEYNMSQGRQIRLKIFDIKHDFDANYIWCVDGVEKQKGKETQYIFSETSIGKHTVVVTMQNEYFEISKTLIVNVCPKEGTFERNNVGQTAWNKVYEFKAAPGQFVNERYTATNMNEAVAYAEDRLKQEGYVSLGGFGGYLVLGFDHSVKNDGSYNIEIKGNSFAGSSEPGIVWVMQDENGDGLPNDTWYELKGSEYGKPNEIRDYEITYYRPKSPGLSVQWTDNQGESGVIDYLGFHTQDYYYPLWVKEDSYKLRGTKLPSNTRETSPGYWYNGEYEWGYVDNYSSVDRLTSDINYSAAANGNHFKISDAITFDGKPANLKYIDFVKIVTGVNCKAGWLGEISTEVFNVKDFNLIK